MYKDYSDNKFYLDFIYEKSLGEDLLTSIFLNNLKSGERLPNISKSDILVAGCSFTAGNGLSNNGIRWPNYLEKKLNTRVGDVSKSAASISGIVSRVFDYIDLFGNPKAILCLFPDPFRLYFPQFKNFLTNPSSSKYNKNNDIFLDDAGFYNINTLERAQYMPRYSKMPHEIQNVVPIGAAIYLSIQQIKLLELYCSVADIRLVYGTWDYNTHNLIEILKEISDYKYFKNYKNVADFGVYSWRNNIDIATNSTQHSIFKKSFWKESENEIKHRKNLIKNFKDDGECHKELRDVDKETFDIASDNIHWGSHSNIHLADFFYEQIKDIV